MEALKFCHENHVREASAPSLQSEICKMKAFIFSLGACLSLFWGALTAQAATVWTGPTITYTQPAAVPSQPENQDPLTPKVVLTRALSSGMFNAVSETFYTHNVSPAGTEWSVGSLENYA